MKKLICWVLLLLLAGTILIGLDNRLTLTEYTIANDRIPSGFDGYRIAVVSDLHAVSFGERQQELLAMLRRTECDLICILGDIVDHDTADFTPVWDFIDGMAGIPMLYVAGNNELSMADYTHFLAALEERGVTVLDDIDRRTYTAHSGTDSIRIHGQPFRDSRHIGDRIPVAEAGSYNILLYHDPYCFPEAALLDYDLMLAGHIHGGVVRLPLLGSPIELLGIEPYTKGVYTDRAATLVVSGGMGLHETIPRFFNAPEVVLITLSTSEN